MAAVSGAGLGAGRRHGGDQRGNHACRHAGAARVRRAHQQAHQQKIAANRDGAGGQIEVQEPPHDGALDELWALAPFLLAPWIGFGAALGSTAALLYAPFAQRSLILMGAGSAAGKQQETGANQ